MPGRPKGSKDRKPRYTIPKWWNKETRLCIRLYDANKQDILELLDHKDEINKRNKRK